MVTVSSSSTSPTFSRESSTSVPESDAKQASNNVSNTPIYIIVGNPGAGKSFIFNGLVANTTFRSIEFNDKNDLAEEFITPQSGHLITTKVVKVGSAASGLTRDMVAIETDLAKIIDVPGMLEAAEERIPKNLEIITNTIKSNKDNTIVVFPINLSFERIMSQDLSMLHQLRASFDINIDSLLVIFNKVPVGLSASLIKSMETLLTSKCKVVHFAVLKQDDHDFAPLKKKLDEMRLDKIKFIQPIEQPSKAELKAAKDEITRILQTLEKQNKLHEQQVKKLKQDQDEQLKTFKQNAALASARSSRTCQILEFVMNGPLSVSLTTTERKKAHAKMVWARFQSLRQLNKEQVDVKATFAPFGGVSYSNVFENDKYSTDKSETEVTTENETVIQFNQSFSLAIDQWLARITTCMGVLMPNGERRLVPVECETICLDKKSIVQYSRDAVGDKIMVFHKVIGSNFQIAEQNGKHRSIEPLIQEHEIFIPAVLLPARPPPQPSAPQVRYHGRPDDHKMFVLSLQPFPREFLHIFGHSIVNRQWDFENLDDFLHRSHCNNYQPVTHPGFTTGLNQAFQCMGHTDDQFTST